MPHGWKVSYPFDSTKFIRISIEEVVKTLIEAIGLVVLVMFIFLQSWRATLIPVIAVPVVMMGTFCVLRLMGYSINTLTMFGMVLSIGLLVDDAIVVVENVERLMREEDLSPLDATIRSMKEMTWRRADGPTLQDRIECLPSVSCRGFPDARLSSKSSLCTPIPAVK